MATDFLFFNLSTLRGAYQILHGFVHFNIVNIEIDHFAKNQA
jgi:hypothetical protein